jgi:pyruvate dehydrogenase E1 component
MPSPSRRPPVISDGLPSHLLDIGPGQTRGWLESLDAVVDNAERNRARYVMLSRLQRARERQVGVPSRRSTHDINTLPAQAAPWLPREKFVERRLRADVRCDAAIMVHRARRPGVGIGGHTCAWAAAMSERAG